MSPPDQTAASAVPPEEPADGVAPSEHAYDALRARILSGQLAPGSTFSQVQLAQQLGISRTPLREAVRRLQSEGLVRSEHNRRVRVSPLSTRDFEQLYTMRIALDSLAVRISVPHLSAGQLDAVRESYRRTTEAAAKGDLPGYRAPHRRFHMGLSAHAGGRLLAQVEDLWDHADRYRLLYHGHAGDQTQIMQLASREHAEILAAAEQGDAERCARRLAAHLARTALMTMVRVDPRHDPSGIRAALDLVDADEPTAGGQRDGVSSDVPVLGYERDQ
jgi:DNA-binding GntR family transcriptional regulator